VKACVALGKHVSEELARFTGGVVRKQRKGLRPGDADRASREGTTVTDKGEAALRARFLNPHSFSMAFVKTLVVASVICRKTRRTTLDSH
jgi:hypothetical protein